MNDRTIEHEADVRVVIRDEITTKFPDGTEETAGIVLLDEAAVVNATYNNLEVSSYIQDHAETINRILHLLESYGLVITYE